MSSNYDVKNVEAFLEKYHVEEILLACILDHSHEKQNQACIDDFISLSYWGFACKSLPAQIS